MTIESVKKRFYRNVGFLQRNVASLVDRLSGITFSNGDLKKAASRVTVPQPFYPYIEIMEKTLGIKFPLDLLFSKEEVRSSDVAVIKTFSKGNFNFSQLNLSYLVKAGYTSAKELGIIRGDGRLHETITPEESLGSYANTSAGYPTFKKKGNIIAVDDALEWARLMLRKPELSNILSQPTAVFHRFQYKVTSDLGTIRKKIRAVWGVSFRQLVYSGVFFRPVVSYSTAYVYSRKEPASTWGRTRYEISTSVIPMLRSHKRRIVSVDVTAFDSNVPGFMWALFYAICVESISLVGYSSYHLDAIMAFDCFTPYCWNSTVLQFQRKGVPSGSLTTSLFNTWVSRTVINYACLEHTHGKFTALNTSCCLGDDMIFAERYTNLVHVETVYARFGLPISAEKSSVSSWSGEMSFLGYIWDTQNRPYELESWYIAHLALPSRFFTDLKIPVSVMQTYRGISICMGLHGGMEMFERLVGHSDFVWKDFKRRYYEEGEQILIRYVGEDQRLMAMGIPLSTILSEGWKAF